jgi:hypothetical protein
VAGGGGLEWGPAGDSRGIARHLIACRLVSVVVGDRTDTGGVGKTQGVIRLLEYCSAGSSTGK